MNSNQIVTGDRPPMAIRYNYDSRKFQIFISDEVYVSTEPGVTYLSCYPDNQYNLSIFPVIFTRVTRMQINFSYYCWIGSNSNLKIAIYCFTGT